MRMGVHAGKPPRPPWACGGLGGPPRAGSAVVAHGGQVVLSEAAAVLVRESLPTGASLRSLGLHRLKDLGRPETYFQLEVARAGNADLPPLSLLDNPALKNNLPAQLTSFIGAAPEVRRPPGLCGVVATGHPDRAGGLWQDTSCPSGGG